MDRTAYVPTLTLLALCILGTARAYKRVPVESAASVLDRVDSREDQEVSLFRGDAAVLSDQDIARILSTHLTFAARRRIAVLRLGRPQYWSEEHATSETGNMTLLLERLRTAHGVSEARELPLLLVPEKKTIPFLREAAARFQADLLLAYDTRVQTFSKYRLLGKDEAKALCTIEAVLLDVRTGIIPFSARATQEISVEKHPEEINFPEAVARATAEAEGKALQKASDDLLRFLDAHGDT